MDDSLHTRFARLRADVERADGHNLGTRVSRTTRTHQPVLVNHADLFNHHQRRLSQMLADYARPGVVVFALHWSRGIAGHCWLSATDELRAGTIGRHSSVDLFLDDDPELSLRHLLVLVKTRPTGLWLRFADLATPGGFQAESGGVLRSLEANGPVVLRAASYSLFAFPSGVRRPWDRDADDAWSTLPRRAWFPNRSHSARWCSAR